MIAKRFLFRNLPKCQNTNSLAQHQYNVEYETLPEDHRTVKIIDIKSGMIRITSATTVESDIFQLRSNALCAKHTKSVPICTGVEIDYFYLGDNISTF